MQSNAILMMIGSIYAYLIYIIIYVGVVDRAGGLECGTPEEFCVIVKVNTV